MYSKCTTEEGVATERRRERECTYFEAYLSPHPYSIWTRSNWTQMQQKTLQERGCHKEKRSKQKNKNNNTCEKCDPMKLEVTYIQKTQHRKTWPQIGGENSLTLLHSCYRPRIPFGHVLIECRCSIKHCNSFKNTEQNNRTWELWSDEIRVFV